MNPSAARARTSRTSATVTAVFMDSLPKRTAGAIHAIGNRVENETSGKGGRGDLAIVLSGGGARAAYQAGVLRGLARHLPETRFPFVVGVSAGAINAAF